MKLSEANIKMTSKPKIIIIGIGNAGRQDDALGWLFLDKISEYIPGNYDVEYRYQLQVEDAELISHYDKVIFVDAYVNLNQAYIWQKCEAKKSETFTSHELPPSAIVFLAKQIYNKTPDAYVLGISGVSFELEVGLSDFAEENLAASLSFFNNNLLEKAETTR